MKTQHAKSPCCGARIYRFGARRRQCQLCGRTWSIRPKKRGRPPHRVPKALLARVLLGQHTLSAHAARHGLTPQGFSYRFRQVLRRFVAQPRTALSPDGPLILLVDGLWVCFRGRPWVVYLMALKPCRENQAVFLDPMLYQGREHMRQWRELIDALPSDVKDRISGMVTDNLRGMKSLARHHGWVLQLCHFHLISQLHGRRGRHKTPLRDRPLRERLYQLTRHALELPEGRALQQTLHELRHAVEQPLSARKLRMAVRQFLRDLEHYRAYQTYPQLGLPSTTNTVECMGRLIRDLLRRARYLRSPESLQAWVTGFIRKRSPLTCNGKHFQPNFFV